MKRMIEIENQIDHCSRSVSPEHGSGIDQWVPNTAPGRTNYLQHSSSAAQEKSNWSTFFYFLFLFFEMLWHHLAFILLFTGRGTIYQHSHQQLIVSNLATSTSDPSHEGITGSTTCTIGMYLIYWGTFSKNMNVTT